MFDIQTCMKFVRNNLKTFEENSSLTKEEVYNSSFCKKMKIDNPNLTDEDLFVLFYTSIFILRYTCNNHQDI